MTSSMFAAVEMAPRDPILGLTEAFNADTRPAKVNLGVGVYYDDDGRVPLLEAVREAERQRLEKQPARAYLPIEGFAAYNQAVQGLLFGGASPLTAAGRVATFEALGGTGGLRIGADFLRRLLPTAEVWISDPSWENHRALFEAAGFKVNAYAYYEAASHGVNFSGMKASLEALPAGSIVVLPRARTVSTTCDHWSAVRSTPVGLWQHACSTTIDPAGRASRDAFIPLKLTP